MSLSRAARLAILPAVLTAFLTLGGGEALSQKQKAKKPEPKGQAEELLKPQPRPKKAALAAQQAAAASSSRASASPSSATARPSGSTCSATSRRCCTCRFPDKELVVRNFARPADEVGNRQRASDYTKLDDPLSAFDPDTILCFFGFNESFAGPDGVAKFKADYEKFLDEYAQKYPRDDAGSPPRFVIVSPDRVRGDRRQVPAGRREGERQPEALRRRRQGRGREAGSWRSSTCTPRRWRRSAKEPGLQFTINGCHVNEAGDKLVGEIARPRPLRRPTTRGAGTPPEFEKLRAAVNDKSWVHQQDYRMLNGWYVYGGRRTFDTETFPREYVKIRNMAAVRDRYVWDIAQGKHVAAKPDDSQTGDLFVPPTRFGQVGKSRVARGAAHPAAGRPHQDLHGAAGLRDQAVRRREAVPRAGQAGADELRQQGPALGVAPCRATRMWKPGDPKPADKLLILEDTDGDGKADKCTVFYDKLHCPTGFEFFNGGVLVVDQPRLLFLKDTDGDDKADLVVHLIDGWATEDTHHTINAWEFSPGGLLHMLEGVSMSTAVETPWGPFRNFGSSGLLRPRPAHAEGPPLQHARLRQPVVLRLQRVGPGLLRRRHRRQPALGHAAVRRPVPGPQGAQPGLPDRGHAARRRQRVPRHAGSSPTTCRGSSSTPASST